jgi:hypothetical protein
MRQRELAEKMGKPRSFVGKVEAIVLAELLTAAGLTPLSDSDWVANCPGDDKAAVLLAVVPADVATAGALEATVRAAASRGDRVIAVWIPGTTEDGLPASLEDYGTALIAWDPVALHAAICGDEPEWQDAGGGQRESPKLGLNKNC